jgi:uncharacterized RmlC-like cupin family protein
MRSASPWATDGSFCEISQDFGARSVTRRPFPRIVQPRVFDPQRQEEHDMDTRTSAPVRFVVRGSEPFTSAQGSRYAPGVSAETTGATALFLGLVTLPAGERTKAHAHERHESAHYMLSGEEVELWTGPRLERREVAQPGDYLFIPAGMPHVAVNRGRTPAVFLGARNEASAQESVLMLPELDPLVP